MTVDYAAILAKQRTIPPVITQCVAGVRRLLLAAGFTPVYLGPVPPQPPPPDVLLQLTPYNLVDDIDAGDVLFGLQVRFRGTANGGVQTLLDRQESVLTILGQLEDVDIADDVNIAKCWRQSSAPLAPDSVGRPEGFDNYYIRTNRLALS